MRLPPVRNSIVALDPKTLEPKATFKPDIPAPFNTSPIVFQSAGKTFVAAASKDGRVHVLDGAAALVSSTAAAGAITGLATWEDSRETWIAASVNGPTSNGARCVQAGRRWQAGHEASLVVEGFCRRPQRRLSSTPWCSPSRAETLVARSGRRPRCSTRSMPQRARSCGTAPARSRHPCASSGPRAETVRSTSSHPTVLSMPSASQWSDEGMPKPDTAAREARIMRTFVCCVVAAVCCGAGWSVKDAPGIAVGAAAGAQPDGAALLTDWLTDGGDNQRTGWNKAEKILTKDNVKNLKLLWKLETGNRTARAACAHAGPGGGPSERPPSGPKQVGFVNGISDNLYAFDVETGKMLWQKHWDYAEPAGGGAGGAGRSAFRARASRVSSSRRQQRHTGDRSARRAGAAGRRTSSPATACCTF